MGEVEGRRRERGLDKKERGEEEEKEGREERGEEEAKTFGTHNFTESDTHATQGAPWGASRREHDWRVRRKVRTGRSRWKEKSESGEGKGGREFGGAGARGLRREEEGAAGDGTPGAPGEGQPPPHHAPEERGGGKGRKGVRRAARRTRGTRSAARVSVRRKETGNRRRRSKSGEGGKGEEGSGAAPGRVGGSAMERRDVAAPRQKQLIQIRSDRRPGYNPRREGPGAGRSGQRVYTGPIFFERENPRWGNLVSGVVM